MACMQGKKGLQLESKQRGGDPGRGVAETLSPAHFPFTPEARPFLLLFPKSLQSRHSIFPAYF